jgi:outer membrane protein OmpA-like peptidoglycan-associated protein
MSSSAERDARREEEQEAPPVATAAPEAAPAVAPAQGVSGLSPASMLALQRGIGNHAVGRLVARDLLGDVGNALGDAFDMRTGEEELDAHEELETFRSTPLTPLRDHHPTSGLGQFDVDADMRAGTMNVTLKVGYNFTEGNAAQVSAGFRPEEFQWTEAEKTAWKERYQREVSALWSGHFQARSTKPHWEAMTVDTTIVVVEDSADPHFTLNVAKYPPDAGMVQSSICPPGFHHDATTGNCAANAAGDGSGTADLDSNDMRPEQKLDWGNAVTPVQFAEGSTALNAAGTAALAPIITTLTTTAGSHVELTGHASSTHRTSDDAAAGAIRNMDLARERTAAVQNALLAGGATAEQILVRNVGEEGADAGVEWCRVDAQVGTQQTQNPALHETGHMLGSDDEYATTGSPAGSAVDAGYQGMITNQTGETVTTGNNEDAMSMGSTVRRWNYAAFLEGLKTISGTTDWTL